MNYYSEVCYCNCCYNTAQYTPGTYWPRQMGQKPSSTRRKEASENLSEDKRLVFFLIDSLRRSIYSVKDTRYADRFLSKTDQVSLVVRQAGSLTELRRAQDTLLELQTEVVAHLDSARRNRHRYYEHNGYY